MSETNTNTPPEVEEAPAETEDTPTPEREVDWKAQSRKWEERSKANAKAAQQLADMREENQTLTSKVEQLTEQLEEIHAKAAEKSMREEISQATGIPAHLLHGKSREEMQDYAQQLVEWVKQKANPTVTLGGEPEAKPDEALEFANRLFS